MNNELYGISLEVALADAAGVTVCAAYRARSDSSIVKQLVSPAQQFLAENNINLTEHVAENGNVHDFLAGRKTVSVKSSKRGISAVAPQVIGQCTPDTFYRHFTKYLSIDSRSWEEMSYQDKSLVFKESVLDNSCLFLDEYWENVSQSDYFILADNVSVPERSNLYLIDLSNPPLWENYRIDFTKPDVGSWNESNTVKADGVSIGEFQVHRNRNCFKFRFKFKGLRDLGIITY